MCEVSSLIPTQQDEDEHTLRVVPLLGCRRVRSSLRRRCRVVVVARLAQVPTGRPRLRCSSALVGQRREPMMSVRARRRCSSGSSQLALAHVHSVIQSLIQRQVASLLPLRVPRDPRKQTDSRQNSLPAVRHQIPARTCCKPSSRLNWHDALTSRHDRKIVRFRHLPPRSRLAGPRLLAQQLGQRQGETRHRRAEKDPRRHRQGPRYQLCLVGCRLLQRRQQGRILSGPFSSSVLSFPCSD